jgi:MFS family permease
MMYLNSRSQILWRQVWGLAALLAAIIFSWMAYGFYQPKILYKLEFEDLANWLGILQGFLAAFIEPFVGGMSDRIQRRFGSRIPIISVGVALAGLIFIVSSLLVEQKLTGFIRWIVPVMMTFWVIAMIIFRGPAIALLRQLAPDAELPQANSILVLIFGLVGATGPLLNMLLQNIGASITFVLGAIVLVLGAYFLQSSVPTQKSLPSFVSSSLSTPSPPTILLISIFAVGLASGLEVNLLMGIFPQALHSQLSNIQPDIIASLILLISAFASFPLGKWTAKFGINKSMLVGLGAITILMGLTLLNQNNIISLVLIIGFGIAFGVVFIAMIPFALGKVPPSLAGLATGLYFGGSGAAATVFSILMKLLTVNPFIAFCLGAMAFFVAFVFIGKSKKYQFV